MEDKGEAEGGEQSFKIYMCNQTKFTGPGIKQYLLTVDITNSLDHTVFCEF